MGPIKVMRYSPVFDTVISADDKGIIEYWSPHTLQFPESEYVLVDMPSNHYYDNLPEIYRILISI